MLVGGMREALTERPIELGEDVNGDVPRQFEAVGEGFN